MESATDERTITLTNDIYMTDEITVPEGVIIRITDDGMQRTLIRDEMDMWMFWVPEDSTLELKGTKAEGLVLDGSSSSIKAGPDGALLIGEYADFVLENVVLKDNRTNSGLGGLMRLVSCNVTATNSVLTGGTSKSGGAVYAIESTLDFTNCDVSDNRSTQGHGGAMYVDNASTLNLIKCTLNNNVINTGAGYGGAVIITNFTQANIVDTTFDGNYVEHEGNSCGAAMYIAWGSVANISGETVFSNNTAKASGTALALGGAVAFNVEGVGSFENCVFEGNYLNHDGYCNGAALYIGTDSNAEIKGNTLFKDNWGTSTDGKNACGGAVYINVGSTGTFGEGVKFTNNYGSHGGALYVINTGKAILNGVTFDGNYTIVGHGGAVYAYNGGNLQATNCTFTNNSIKSDKAGYGGALAVANADSAETLQASATITGCVFDSNSSVRSSGDAAANGGAIYIGLGADAAVNGNTVFKNNKVSGGSGKYNGGAIYTNTGCVVNVGEGVKFEGNEAQSNGGAIAAAGAAAADWAININGAAFTGNKAANNAAVYADTYGTVTINGVTITPATGATTNDITIPAGETMNVAGKVALGTVAYESDASMIKLTGAVEGTATLIPAKYEEGLQVVTADNAALLSGIGDKFVVADNGEEPWEVTDAGTLKNMKPTVMIGETGYLTLDEALAAAKAGDEIKIMDNTKVNADAEVPAGVTIVADGKTITVADGKTLTVSDGALKGAVVTGNVAAKDGADLSGAAITGNVTVAEDSVLTVGGSFTATKVQLSKGATVNVATALTAEGKAFELNSAVETVDTVLVTAPDAAAITAAAGKINAVFVDSKVSLDETTGKIKSDIYVAYIERDGQPDSYYESIEDAIANAAATDVIVLRKSLTVTEQIRVEKDITIDGAGFTLTRGAELTTAMIYVPDVAGASLTLDKITLDGNGANVTATQPIISNRGQLTLNSGVIIQNVNGTSAGAAIYSNLRNVEGTKLTINGATIKNNETTGNGAICVNGGTADVTGATFTGNKAANGAAIYMQKGDLTVNTGSTFETNAATKHGGAVYMLTGDLTIDGATFTGNTAGGNGGALELVDPTTAEIENTTFTGNKALNTFDDPDIVTDTGAGTTDDKGTYGKGGAISADTRQTVKLTDVIATGNTARQGGVMYNYSDATITGGTYGGDTAAEGNSATDAGGVFMNANEATAKLTVSGGTYKNNKATNNAGVFYTHTNSAGLELTGVTVASNSAKNGGVILSNGSPVTINSGTFTGNTATLGGVIYNKGTLTIEDGTFTGNTSSSHGGVIYTEKSVTINSGTFGGTGDGEGNKTTGSSAAGGVIYHCKAGTVTINGGTFTGNTAPSAGGVYFNANGSGGVCTLDINGGTFSYNSSTGGGNGGVIYNHNLNIATIDNATFQNNKGVNGGALFNNDTGKMTVTSCTFIGNEATGTNGGGAVFVKGTVVITGTEEKNSIFDGNTAAKGGAVYLHTQAAENVTISHASFKNNTAKTNGGAVYVQKGTATIESTCAFSGTEKNMVGTTNNDIYHASGTLKNSATAVVASAS